MRSLAASQSECVLYRCTEQFQPFSRDGKHDMYWDQVSLLDRHVHHNCMNASVMPISGKHCPSQVAFHLQSVRVKV